MQDQAARVLQRAARARPRPSNRIDPITQEPPPIRGRFLLVTERAVLAYAPAPLRAYMEAVHTRTDPLTRRELNRVELLRLAHLTGGRPLRILDSEREARVAWQAAVDALEREAGDHIDRLRDAAGLGSRVWQQELSRRRRPLLSALRDCAHHDINAHNSLVQHSCRRLLFDLERSQPRSPDARNRISSLLGLLMDEVTRAEAQRPVLLD